MMTYPDNGAYFFSKIKKRCKLNDDWYNLILQDFDYNDENIYSISINSNCLLAIKKRNVYLNDNNNNIIFSGDVQEKVSICLCKDKLIYKRATLPIKINKENKMFSNCSITIEQDNDLTSFYKTERFDYKQGKYVDTSITEHKENYSSDKITDAETITTNMKVNYENSFHLDNTKITRFEPLKDDLVLKTDNFYINRKPARKTDFKIFENLNKEGQKFDLSKHYLAKEHAYQYLVQTKSFENLEPQGYHYTLKK